MKIYLRRSGFLRINVSSDTGAWPTHLAALQGFFLVFLDSKARVGSCEASSETDFIQNYEKAYVRLFIGPRSDHSLPMSVTD